MKYGLVVTLLLVASLGANFAFYRQTKTKAPVDVSEKSSAYEGRLRTVAEQLGVRESASRQPCDLLLDIQLAVDSALPAPKELLSESTVQELKRVLTADENRQLRAGQDFLRKLGGGKVLVVEGGAFR